MADEPIESEVPTAEVPVVSETAEQTEVPADVLAERSSVKFTTTGAGTSNTDGSERHPDFGRGFNG